MLNLTATNKQEELVLAYLQENASETLTEKINNGVHIEKDGKRLLNKKDLKGFMRFACEQARELAEKGSNSACVEDSIVYGWAIHYFEENSIVGTLYNEDGTEYKPTPKSKNKPQTTVAKKEPPKPTQKHFSLFDFTQYETDTQKEPTAQEVGETTTPPTAEQEEKFFDEFDSNVRMLSSVEETENDEAPPSGTVQAAAVDTPTSKVTEQQPTQTNSPAELTYYKYEIMQKQYPDSILFYRLGDFYEAFGKSAELASDCLDLTLTGKNCGSVGRIPLCGVPYHAVDVYVEKLRNYYDVVLMHSDTELQVLPKKELETVTETTETDSTTADYNIDDYTNKETGEITLPKIDNDLFNILYELLDGQIVMG